LTLEAAYGGPGAFGLLDLVGDELDEPLDAGLGAGELCPVPAELTLVVESALLTRVHRTFKRPFALVRLGHGIA
jgi:hypothetical protein